MIVAATLLGPDDIDSLIWHFCRDRASTWADRHVVLTDENGDAFGNESEWRQRLWDQAVAACDSDDDWIFVLDADFVLTKSPAPLCDSDTPSWNFLLYDLWQDDGETAYREDIFWRAHLNPRAWMFNVAYAPDEPQWHIRGIHVGHYPANFPGSHSAAPSDIAILHLGWLTPEIRRRKIARYMQDRVWKRLSPFERRHVESVEESEPNLKPLAPEFEESLNGLSTS